MEDYRSKSYGDGRMEMEVYSNHGGERNGNGYPYGEGGLEDLRSYSASAASQSAQNNNHNQMPKQLKKGKSTNGSISSSSSYSKAVWCFSDPELQRKKRVASYKSFTVEGKIKRSFSKSFRWLKDRYSNLTNGS